MDTIKNWINRLSNLLLIMTMICLVLMMVNITADILLRILFDYPVAATAEITAFYYMVAAVFLPLPLVELRNESIKVDLVYDIAPLSLKKIINVFAYFAQIVFFSIMFIQTGQDAIDAYIKQDFVDSQIKLYIWPGRFFLPLGFGVATLVSILKMIDSAKAAPEVNTETQSIKEI